MGSEAPSSPRFFVLQEGVLGSRYDTDVEDIEPVNIGEGARCSRCGDPVGMLPRLPPHRVELVLHGEELGDFIKATGHELLVSERLAQSFRNEGLTGLEGFHPVEVVRIGRKRRGPKPSHIPRYLAVTARYGRAAVDLTRSRIRYTESPTCDECRYGTKDAVLGFSLEPGTWQGEDIFRPRGLSGSLVVSERFERFVTRHGFTNLRLTPTEEYVWNPLGPHPLPTTKQGSA